MSRAEKTEKRWSSEKGLRGSIRKKASKPGCWGKGGELLTQKKRLQDKKDGELLKLEEPHAQKLRPEMERKS